jgi:hypothetical protein
VANAAFSVIFNLRYWHGVSQALGGVPAFWSLVSAHKPAAAYA